MNTMTVTNENGAPCATVDDPDVFFPEGKNGPENLAQARALCATCPGAPACLFAALARNEQWGVWGGELFEDGKIVAAKRRPGRPRKIVTVA